MKGHLTKTHPIETIKAKCKIFCKQCHHFCHKLALNLSLASLLLTLKIPQCFIKTNWQRETPIQSQNKTTLEESEMKVVGGDGSAQAGTDSVKKVTFVITLLVTDGLKV